MTVTPSFAPTGVKPVIFRTTADVVTQVKAKLTLANVGANVRLQGKFAINQHDDPTAGVVVIVPTLGLVSPPRLTGGNPRATFTINRTLELHVWAAATDRTLGEGQYAADLTATETLLAQVLRVFEIFIPGSKRGGSCDLLDSPEGSTYGVVIVCDLVVQLEQPDATFATSATPTFDPTYEMKFPDGHTDSGSDQF